MYIITPYKDDKLLVLEMVDIPTFSGGWSYTQKEMNTLFKFIEYKNNCVKNGFYYGCVISSDNKFTINHIGTTNEYIVSRFIKFQNKLLYGKNCK